MLKKLFLLTLIALMSNVTFAAVDMFLKIDGIEGESQDAQHRAEIDVLAWSWSAFNDGRKACIQDVSVTKYIDKASPILLMNMALGRSYSSATLAISRPGGSISDNFGSTDFLVLEFKNVKLSSLSTGGSGGEDRLTENITLNFEEVEYTYTEQSPDGSQGDVTTGTIMASKKCN